MAKDPAMGPVSDLEGGPPMNSEDVPQTELTRSEIINNFGEQLGRLLLDAGYASITSLIFASDEELLAITGLGPASLETIREVAPYMPPPEDEPEIPGLASASVSARGPATAPIPDSAAGPPDPSPRFGDPGSVSPRVARIRQAQQAQAPLVELEAEIEVSEEDTEPAPEAPQEADAERAEMAPAADDAEAAETGEAEEPEVAEKEAPEADTLDENPPDYRPGPDVVRGKGGAETVDQAESEPPPE